MSRLTDAETCFIAHSLRIAAHQYLADAIMLRKHGQSEVAKHFADQSTSATELADRIECAHVEVSP